jgi:pyruvate/2-oxoglutarate dehydrogenase complex dihydrolipoamide dehydrogenase (E3) component
MAGLPLALRAARHGRTAFGKELLGGTCLNRGCIPTKTMIASATVAHQVRRAAEFGVHTGAPHVDQGSVRRHRDTGRCPGNQDTQIEVAGRDR